MTQQKRKQIESEDDAAGENAVQPDAPVSKKSKILHYRADSRTLVKNQTDGHLTPVKTSALVNQDAIELRGGVDQERFESAVKRNFASIPGFRQPDKVISFSLQGSPLQIITPNKTILNRVSKNGVFYIFSNHVDGASDAAIVRRVDDGSDFFNSSHYLAIKKPKSEIKCQQVVITPELFEKKDKRSSQNKEMVEKDNPEKMGSATQYAKASQLFPEKKFWEWLHLVAFSVLGKEGQHEGNLVAGTKHANTDMMFVESLINYFSKSYPEGFLLDVEADLIEKTQLAKEIKYTIETKDFVLSFAFNAQSNIKPHVLYQDYIRSLGSALIDAQLKNESAVSSCPVRKKGLSVFFKKIPSGEGVLQDVEMQINANDHLNKTFDALLKKR